VRQRDDQTTLHAPLVFTAGDVVVGDDLRAVGEVAELRFPDEQGVWVGRRVAILEA